MASDAALLATDRLQPSLLDRLTDHAPHQAEEPPSARVLTRRQLREAVLRDLTWLLNAVCEEPDPRWCDDPARIALWQEMRAARDSVLNYGVPALSGRSIGVLQFPVIEEQVRQAIVRFEPRIDRHSLRVRIVHDHATGLRPTSLRMEIKGLLWSQPVPLELLLAAEVDVDCGTAVVRDLKA